MYTSASVSKMASQVAIIGVKVLPQDSAAVLYFLFLKFLLEDRIVFKGVPLFIHKKKKNNNNNKCA